MPSIVRFWEDFIADVPPFVHAADRPLLERMRAQLTSGTYVHLALAPEPYSGDLRNADIFILNANPGFGGTEYVEQYGNPNFRDRLVRTIRQDFETTEYPHVYFDPNYAGSAGYRWWTRHLRGVAPAEILARRVATLDLFPYHSKEFNYGSWFKDLPSVVAIKRYVREDLVPRAKTGEILLIVCRQRENWGFTADEDDGRNLIIYSANHAQGAWLTPQSRGGRAIMDRLGTNQDRPVLCPGAQTECGAPQAFRADNPQGGCGTGANAEIAHPRPTEGPPPVIIDGGEFSLDSHTWVNKHVTDAELEAAAQRLMGTSGPAAISALTAAVERLGPMDGAAIIRQGLDRNPRGPGAQNWTKLFIYAWQHHAILRYMSRPDGTGRSRYCTLDQAMRHRTDR